MAYIKKEKFNIADLVGKQESLSRIVICEPEEYLLALYEHHLVKHDFDVKFCLNVDEVGELIFSFSPRILLLNIEARNSNHNFVLSLRRKFPDLSLVTMGYNIEGEIIKKLMAAGVCGHIDRRLSRPKDLIYIVKAVLNNKN